MNAATENSSTATKTPRAILTRDPDFKNSTKATQAIILAAQLNVTAAWWQPSGNNERRAEQGHAAIVVGTDNETNLNEQNAADAIANVLHYAASKGVNITNVIRRGIQAFGTECDGED